MRSTLVWSVSEAELPKNRQDMNGSYAMSLHPTEPILLYAFQTTLFQYQHRSHQAQQTGAKIATFKTPHTALITALKHSKDGSRFLTASHTDGRMHVWASGVVETAESNPPEPTVLCEVRMLHVVHLAWANKLACCSDYEVGLWHVPSGSHTNPDRLSGARKKPATMTQKFKVAHRITCLEWSPSGRYLALAHINGTVSIRNSSGDEMTRIERNDPVFAMCWLAEMTSETDREEGHADREVLVTADWRGVVSFYSEHGTRVGTDVSLIPFGTGAELCALAAAPNSDCMVAGGAGRTAIALTRTGKVIGTVVQNKTLDKAKQRHHGWIVGIDVNDNYAAVSFQDGWIAMYQINFAMAHSLYQSIYAHRDSLTRVVIESYDDETVKRATIDCQGEYVKKVAVYKDKLAIQLNDLIQIYVSDGVGYTLKHMLQKRIECNLLVITAESLILCMEQSLVMTDYQGFTTREWKFNDTIRYIKVVGGMPGREQLAVGLKNGQVFTLMVDSWIVRPIAKVQGSVRCLDISPMRSKLAVVDDQGSLSLIEIATKKTIFRDTSNVTSVAFNTETVTSSYGDMDGMLCYSGSGTLSIKAPFLEPYIQKSTGFVVGFKGTKIYTLASNHMTVVDVPLSFTVGQYLFEKRFNEALSIACLGVPRNDWWKIADAAILESKFDIVRMALAQVDGYNYLSLLFGDDDQVKDDVIIIGKYLAFRGRIPEAMELFDARSRPDLFKLLNDILGEIQVPAIEDKEGRELSRSVASLVGEEETKQMVVTGDYHHALTVYLKQKRFDQIVHLALELDITDPSYEGIMRRCLRILKRHGSIDGVEKVLKKLDDLNALVDLYVELRRWEDAFRVCSSLPEKRRTWIELQYATFLAQQGNAVQAMKHYKLADRLDLAVDVLRELIDGFGVMNRYRDAAYYSWVLTEVLFDMLPDGAKDQLSKEQHECLGRYHQYQKYADIYYAYSSVYSFIEEPFINLPPDIILHRARYLLHYTGNYKLLPRGIHAKYVLFSIVKLARGFGLFDLARYASSRLLNETAGVDQDWIDYTEIELMKIYAAKIDLPATDLYYPCWNCASMNSFWNRDLPLATDLSPETCPNCRSVYQFCFATFSPIGVIETSAANSEFCSPPTKACIPNPCFASCMGPYVTRCSGCFRFFTSDEFEFLTLATVESGCLCRWSPIAE